MKPLTELKNQVIEHLGGLSDFENALVVPAYPEKPRSFPLNKPLITVEAQGVELKPAGLGGYLGGESPAYGTAASVALRFGIYSEISENCGALFEALCNALFDWGSLSVLKISCDKIIYDTKTSAYLLPASAEIKTAWLVPTARERLFTGIDLKEVNT